MAVTSVAPRSRAAETESTSGSTTTTRPQGERATLTPRYLDAQATQSLAMDVMSSSMVSGPMSTPEPAVFNIADASVDSTVETGTSEPGQPDSESGESAAEETEADADAEPEGTAAADAEEETQGEEEEGAGSDAESEEDQATPEEDEAAEESGEEPGEAADQEDTSGGADNAQAVDQGRFQNATRSRGTGKEFLQATPIPRLGLVTPLVHAPPKPSMERRKEIAEKTGKPPELHHAQVQDALNHTVQGTRDAQRQMVIAIERIAGDTRLSAEEMAAEIPGVVAACVAHINRALEQTCTQVEDAGTASAAHIAQHGVLVGEEMVNNRNATTLRVFEELQGGAEHIDEANQVIQQHFDAKVLDAADQIEHVIPASGAFIAIEPADAAAQQGAEGGSSGGPTPVEKTETAVVEWLPEGAAGIDSDKAGSQVRHYCVTRTEPVVPVFMEPTATQLQEGLSERAIQLNSQATRAEFAILSLGLTAPMEQTHREDANGVEDTLEQQCREQQEVTLSAAEQAQKQVEDKMTGVVALLRNKTGPSLTDNVRKAGHKIQENLLEQGIAAQSALVGASARMAEAYRDLVERLGQLLPQGRFLDARVLVPRIDAALQSARHLRDTQIAAAQEQAFGTVAQLERGKRDQVEGLWNMATQGADSLADVVTQSRFDFMLFAEQMTGEMTEGHQEVMGQAMGFADRMAQNILRMAQRNDGEAIPHLEALAAGFLNGRIGAALDWQRQVLTGHEEQLKSGSGPFSQIWQEIIGDLNRRALAIDQAVPDSGSSVGGAAASALVGAAVLGPAGALVGLGAYLWGKDADEDAVIAALGDLPIPGGPALEELFLNAYHSQLVPRLQDTMDEPERSDAIGLLSVEAADHAAAVASIVEQSDDWFGYNRAARESALRGITPDVRQNLADTSQIEDLRRILTNDLSGSEETISTAYLDGNRELVLAARLQEELDKARREASYGTNSATEAERRGDQALVDVVARIDELARAELMFENAYIPQGRLDAFRDQAFQEYARMRTPEGERREEGYTTEQAREFVINELTAERTVLLQRGDYLYEQRVSMSQGAQDYIRAAVNHGPGSDQAQESRMAYEVERARGEGGELSETTQLRLTQALENPRLSDVRARYERETDPERRALLRQQLAEEEATHQARMARLAESLGAPQSVYSDPVAATHWLGNEIGRLFAREGDEHARYGRELIELGRPTMVAGIALATQKAGTHEDLLLHTYRGRTREELASVHDEWAAENDGEDLEVMLGIRDREWDAADYATFALMPLAGPVPFLALQGLRGGEVSGDVAMQLQQLSRPNTTDLDVANMAGLRVDQQERGTGFIADITMSGASETEVMNERRERLARLILAEARLDETDARRFRANPSAIFGPNGELNETVRNTAFNEDGSFRGDALALRGLTHATGLAADNYQAEIDRQESILTTAISILTIVVSVALLFVPGVNLVAAGILTAVVGGALTMAAKYGMRGERYGWEEAATDLAQTGIEAATAGIGGAMAGGLGRTGALFRAGNAINGAFGKVGGAMVREAITGALSNVAQVAIQDDTFKDGTDRGFERLFNGALKGAAVGAISAGVSEKLGGSVDDAMATGLRRADDVANLSRMQRFGQMLGPNGREVFKEGLSEAMGSSLGEGAGVLLDYANGDFKGSFGDAMKRIGQAGLRDMVSASGRSIAGARNRQRYGELLAAARSQSGDLSPQQARALRLAGISAGVLHYDTPLREVQQQVQVGRQAQQQLPAALQPFAHRLDAETLTHLMQGLESGSFGTPEDKLAFIRKVAEQMPGLDRRDFAQKLNVALQEATSTRARAEVEQAVKRAEQKRLRKALFAGVPGPARKALARLDLDGFEALPPTALRDAAAMIAKGQFDPARSAMLLEQAAAQSPDLDEGEFFKRLLTAIDTSRRAQAAVRETYLKGRRELAGILPGGDWAWIRKIGQTDMPQLQGHVRGARELSSTQLDAMFNRIALQAPELSRAEFDAALEALRQHHQQLQQARPEQALHARIQQLLDSAAAPGKAGLQGWIEHMALQRELLASVPANQRDQVSHTPILRVDDTEFASMTRSSSGEAVTLFIDGKAVIVMRESADPKILREEGLHVLQSQDPAWRERVGMLDERTLARWDELPISEQLALYGNKIAVEIDAQQRLIADLEKGLEGSGGRRTRLEMIGDLELARATLDNLRRRQAEVGAIDTLRAMEMESGLIARPQWLDQPARLFSKTDAQGKLPELDDTTRSRLLGVAPDDHSGRRLVNLAIKSLAPEEFASRLEQVSRALPDDSRADLIAALARKSQNAEALLQEATRLLQGVDAMPDSAASRLLEAALRLETDQINSVRHLADFVMDLGPAARGEMATLLASMASPTAARLLESIGATKASINKLGLADDLRQDLMAGLLGTALHQHQSAEFVISAKRLFEQLHGLQPSPDVDTVLDHLRSKLGGDMSTPVVGDDGKPSQATPRDVGYDLGAAIRQLNGSSDKAAVLKGFVEGIRSQGYMAERDAWQARTSEAQRNWSKAQAQHPEFVSLLRSLQQEQATQGKPVLRDQDLQLLIEIRPWFDEVVRMRQARGGGTFTPEQRLALLVDLLGHSLGKGDDRLDLKPINSADTLRKVMTEIRTDALGHTEEPDFADQVTREIEALGIGDLLDGRRVDNDALMQEVHLEDLIRQRHEYEFIIQRSKAIVEAMADREGWDAQTRAVALAEVESRFRAKLTEVKGEIAAFAIVLKEPAFGAMKMAHGFEEGTGFDQLWFKRNAQGDIVEILVVEAKGPGATLATTRNKGAQMSAEWVAATIKDMLMSSDPSRVFTAGELLYAIHNGAKMSGIVAGPDIKGSQADAGADEAGGYAYVPDSAGGYYDMAVIEHFLAQKNRR